MYCNDWNRVFLARTAPYYQHKCTFVGKIVSRNLKRKTKSCRGTHSGPCLRLATDKEIGAFNTMRIRSSNNSIATSAHSTSQTHRNKGNLKKILRERVGRNVHGARQVKRPTIEICERDASPVPSDVGPIIRELDANEYLNTKTLQLTERQLSLLEDNNQYVDDTVMQAANILLKKSFTQIAGFEDTLFQQRPQLRTRNHPTSRIYSIKVALHIMWRLLISILTLRFSWTL